MRSTHKTLRIPNVCHSSLPAAGTASCSSIARHSENRYGSATPAFAALNVQHPIFFASCTASCSSIARHSEIWSAPATPAFGVFDIHHSIVFASGTASWPSIAWHSENRYGPATLAFGALDVHHPIFLAPGTASSPSIAWHSENRYDPATLAFAALDVHHPIFFAAGAASWPSIAWHSEMWYGPATPAFGVFDVDHPISFAAGAGTASCPSIAWHSENRLYSATPAFRVLDIQHAAWFASGTASCPSIAWHSEMWYGPARGSCVVAFANTGATSPCQRANIWLSIGHATIVKEPVRHTDAGLGVVTLSSQNTSQEQQPAFLTFTSGGATCCESGTMKLPFPCCFLFGNQHFRVIWHSAIPNPRRPLRCPQTPPSAAPARGRRPCAGRHGSGAWQMRWAEHRILKTNPWFRMRSPCSMIVEAQHLGQT